MHPEKELGASGAFPISASEALQKFGDCLTAYEKTEILQYGAVYYAGQRCIDKVKSPTDGYNNGYDTQDGDYNFRIQDHIAYRFEVLGVLGNGAFGQVVKAVDHAHELVVAVKLIRNDRRVLKQAEHEIRILQHLNGSDPKGLYGIVCMRESFEFRGHICITYELLGANLYEYLKSKDFFPMPLSLIRKISARMLVTLTFLDRENVIHSDLKPENIVLRDADPSVVKVVDLGSACFDVRNMYVYIQSRFYRAPEVILEQKYGKAIDWWSFGCILCELANGDPVFSGEDDKDQLGCIMEYLGPPPVELIVASSPRRRRHFFDENHKPRTRAMPIGKQREPGSKSLARFLGVSEDDEFLSFVRLFLQWDPSQRVAPREAMKHPWICNEFVFPTSSEKKPRLSSLREDGSDTGTRLPEAYAHQGNSAPLKSEDSISATVGKHSIAAEVPLNSVQSIAAPLGAQPSAPLSQPPASHTSETSTVASCNDDNTTLSGTVPTFCDAPAGTAACSAVQSTDASSQWPRVQQRRLIGRMRQRQLQRRVDIVGVEVAATNFSLPGNSTPLKSPSNTKESVEKKDARAPPITACAASSITTTTPQIFMEESNAKSHELQLADGVRLPKVPPPNAVPSSAKAAIATSQRGNTHLPECEAVLSPFQQFPTSRDVNGKECNDCGTKGTPPSMLELHQSCNSSKVETDVVHTLDRGECAAVLNSFSRWLNVAGAAASGKDFHTGAGVPPEEEEYLSMSTGVSRGPHAENTVQERREYSINLDTRTVSLGEMFQSASVREMQHAEECIQHSELSPYGYNSRAGNPLRGTASCRQLAGKLSDSRINSGVAPVSIQSHSTSFPASHGPSNTVVPFSKSGKPFHWRSARIDLTSFGKRGTPGIEH